MKSTKNAILPGLLIGILVLVLLSRLVDPTQIATAAADADPQSDLSEPNLKETNPSCLYSDRYPEKIRPWCTLIEIFSSKYEMDPLLIAAVMLQESGGQPEVMSTSGAVGLMQIMPRDGIAANFNCINGPCFADRPSIAELKDPSFNINFGVRMLSGLIKRHGDIREALKAYGPEDVNYSYADKVLAIRKNL
ncbi:MAG: transglycosylase SLT domain-containing protein [Chloroflexi bacterium]|nr:transglycosylase SLT domain-containing protein [Chloroflexota bacterium]